MGGILDGFIHALEGAVIAIVNILLAALGAVVNGLLAILPSMPSLPSLPTAFITAESWVAWFFPVSAVIDVLATVLTLWLAWQVTAIALRWLKGMD